MLNALLFQMPVSSKLSSTNFLRQFRNAESRELNKLSAVQFMEVWDHYDNDGKKHWKYGEIIIQGFSVTFELFRPI